MIFKNNFDPKKDFVPILHILIKNPQIFNSSPSIIYENESLLYHIFARNIEVQRFTHKSEQIKYKIHHLRIFHETSRVRPFSNVPGESRINNRQWNVNDRHVSTTAVPTLWIGGGEGRERQSVPRLGPSRGSTGDFDTGIPREVFIHQALVRLTGETGIS